MKTFAVKAMLLGWLIVIGPNAFATFLPITVAPNGSAPTASYLQVVATGRGGNATESLLSPILAPYAGEIRTVYRTPNDSAYSDIDTFYGLGATNITIDIPKFDRSGPSGSLVHGAWLFSTSNEVRANASGYLDVYSSESTTNNVFQVVLDDLSAGTRLLSHEQSVVSSGGRFDLPTNDYIFEPNHAYRLLYTVYTGANDAAAGTSLARAQIAFIAIPEPQSLVLIVLGLLPLIAVRRYHEHGKFDKKSHRSNVNSNRSRGA